MLANLRVVTDTSQQQIQVLHVDDDSSVTDLTKTFLEREDDRLVIKTATSADDGLQIINEHPPDCIVSDYNMPGMDGLEFLQAVREDKPNLPFILYTGKGSEEIASNAISAGVTDYLQKGGGTNQYTILANRIANAVSRYHAQTNYQELFESTEVGLVVDDVETGTILDVNQAYADIAGYDRQDIIGKNPAELSSASSVVTEADAEQLITKAVQDGPQSFEWHHETEDGEKRWADVTLTPVVLDGRQLVLASVTDISGHKQREQKLQRYERIIKNLDDVATVIQPDGTITYVSPSVQRLLGYEPADLLGENGFEYQPPETREAVADGIEHVLENPGEPHTVQTRFRQADGSWCWIESTLRNRLDDAVIDGILVSSRDITQRRQRKKQLQERNERLEEFTSVVSHDLRNPLTVAEGHLELAQDTCESDHLARAADAIDRSQALIKDLLTLALEGEGVAEVKPVKIADVAESSWQAVKTADAALETYATETIQANRSRLRQLFENLFRNAVEYGGDDLTVSVGATGDGFYVADTGSGIPETEREEVFKTGYSTSEEGTGFGLRIVEQVANAHGWEVTVIESEQGGARFEIIGVERTAS